MSKSGHSNILFYAILSVITCAFFWIYFAEIEEVVRADGAVEPAGKVQTIASQFSGIVKQVHISVGDNVNPEKILVELEDGDAKSTLAKNTANIAHLSGQISRLEAESTGEDFIIFAETVAPLIQREQTALFNSNNVLLKQRLSVIDEQIFKENQTIKDLENSIIGLADLSEIKSEELAIYRPLVEQGLEPRVSIIRLKAEIQDLSNKLKTQAAKIETGKIEIQALLKQKQEVILNSQNIARSELVQKENELRLMKADTNSLRKRVENSKLKSPVNGIVTKVNIAGVGAVINGGEVIVEIIPLSETLVFKAKLSPTNIADVKIGQPCKIALNSFDYTIHGKLDAVVSRVAQNTTTGQNGETFYDIWIETRKIRLDKSNLKPDLIPGMIGQVEIIGKKRTIFEYLMKPIIQASSKAMTEK